MSSDRLFDVRERFARTCNPTFLASGGARGEYGSPRFENMIIRRFENIVLTTLAGWVPAFSGIVVMNQGVRR
jgi:hypothetical protein